jgi:hypothetical protein
MMTLQPTAKYATFLFLLFSTSLLLLLFSIILLPPLAFVYAHSLLCASFSLAILHSVSITLFACILLWTSKLWKCAQLPTTNINYFQRYPIFFILERLVRCIHFLPCPLFFNQHMILEINMAHHYKFMCPLYNHMEALNIIIMKNVANFIFQLCHICNLLTLAILTPPCSLCTPSVDYAHLSTNCDNTSIDYIDFFVNCANNYNDCANIPDD